MSLLKTQASPGAETLSSLRFGNKSATSVHTGLAESWKGYEIVLFRFFLIYFSLQIIPLDWKYYRDIATLDWSSLHFSNLFYVAKYAPRIFGEVPVFLDWVVIAVIAAVGTIAWQFSGDKRTSFNTLYYWLRVGLRYRLAAALLAYGFIKFFPMQMPLPSIGNLNTSYGDITDWKVFAMSTGIVPGYQSFLGLIEIVAALLLLYRKTATIGAFFVLPFTGNVVLSNLAYEGGEYVYGLLLVSFAAFLFIHDVPGLSRLTSFDKLTEPPRNRNFIQDINQKNFRIIAKSAFVAVFVLFYGFRTYASYSDGGYQYPKAKGLTGSEGLYDVAEFTINGKVLPYSKTDELRWQDVAFEKWATLSIRSNRPVQVIASLTEEIATDDAQRRYEVAGTGSRKYYSYVVDSVNNKLILENRNPNDAEEAFTLDYSRPNKDKIVLSGVTPQQDSLHVVLHRIDKKYLLKEAAKNGRRRGLKL